MINTKNGWRWKKELWPKTLCWKLGLDVTIEYSGHRSRVGKGYSNIYFKGRGGDGADKRKKQNLRKEKDTIRFSGEIADIGGWKGILGVGGSVRIPRVHLIQLGNNYFFWILVFL